MHNIGLLTSICLVLLTNITAGAPWYGHEHLGHVFNEEEGVLELHRLPEPDGPSFFEQYGESLLRAPQPNWEQRNHWASQQSHSTSAHSAPAQAYGNYPGSQQFQPQSTYGHSVPAQAYGHYPDSHQFQTISSYGHSDPPVSYGYYPGSEQFLSHSSYEDSPPAKSLPGSGLMPSRGSPLPLPEATRPSSHSTYEDSSPAQSFPGSGLMPPRGSPQPLPESTRPSPTPAVRQPRAPPSPAVQSTEEPELSHEALTAIMTAEAKEAVAAAEARAKKKWSVTKALSFTKKNKS